MNRNLDDKSFCARPLAIGVAFLVLLSVAIRKSLR